MDGFRVDVDAPHLAGARPLTLSTVMPIVESEIEGITEAQEKRMTESQQMRIQVRLGELADLQDALSTLIHGNIENGDLVERLLLLNDRISEAIAKASSIIPTNENIQPTEYKQEPIESPRELNDSLSLRVSQVAEIFDYSDEEPEVTQQSIANSPFHAIECPICFEEYKDPNSLITLTACGHQFCLECVEHFLHTKIDDGHILQTCCLLRDCGVEIIEEDAEKVLNENIFAKYQRFLFLARLRENKNCRWCPKPECASAVIGNSRNEKFPQLECTECHTLFCFHCSREWHPNTSCDEHWKQIRTKEDRKQENQAIKWQKKLKTQICDGCNAVVEKKEGCNHMTCMCGYQWCWICGDKYHWDHYYKGKCKGLHMTNYPTLRKITGRSKKAGKIGAVGAGVIVATPLVLGAGVIAIGVAVPLCAVAVPIGGAYYLKKKL